MHDIFDVMIKLDCPMCLGDRQLTGIPLDLKCPLITSLTRGEVLRDNLDAHVGLDP